MHLVCQFGGLSLLIPFYIVSYLIVVLLLAAIVPLRELSAFFLILCSHYLTGFIYLVRVHRLTPRTLSICSSRSYDSS